ncbi:MAG: GNAT family N-acetyltransferase, partial [Deltaproteobacteria bacterium]|nr:GNAT family N-acetyltransferase [Deltaproteobacteria bacterium]
LVRDGYLVRRAKPGEPRVASWVGHHFGRGWRHEVSVALAQRPASVHVVEHSGRIVGFAAHSARLAGLGTFGPTGVLPRHRGKGIGQLLLSRCLRDLEKAGHAQATIAWVGPRDWYAKACGAVVEREYVTLARTMT